MREKPASPPRSNRIRSESKTNEGQCETNIFWRVRKRVHFDAEGNGGLDVPWSSGYNLCFALPSRGLREAFIVHIPFRNARVCAENGPGDEESSVAASLSRSKDIYDNRAIGCLNPAFVR